MLSRYDTHFTITYYIVQSRVLEDIIVLEFVFFVRVTKNGHFGHFAVVEPSGKVGASQPRPQAEA